MFQIVYTYTKDDSTEFQEQDILSITSLSDPCTQDKSSYNVTQQSTNFLGFDAVLSEDGRTLTVTESWIDSAAYFTYESTRIVPEGASEFKNNVKEGFSLTLTSRTI